jgi:hypothetical protein
VVVAGGASVVVTAEVSFVIITSNLPVSDLSKQYGDVAGLYPPAAPQCEQAYVVQDADEH